MRVTQFFVDHGNMYVLCENGVVYKEVREEQYWDEKLKKTMIRNGWAALDTESIGLPMQIKEREDEIPF